LDEIERLLYNDPTSLLNYNKVFPKKKPQVEDDEYIFE